jgi:hypothetical protein
VNRGSWENSCNNTYCARHLYSSESPDAVCEPGEDEGTDCSAAGKESRSGSNERGRMWAVVAEMKVTDEGREPEDRADNGVVETNRKRSYRDVNLVLGKSKMDLETNSPYRALRPKQS